MTIRTIPLLALGLMVAGPALAQAPTDNVIRCSGPFGKDSSFKLLQDTFGADNVTTEAYDGVEGETGEVTVVYAKDPTKRLEFTWLDDETKTGLAAVDVPGDSQWVSEAGMKNGATLADVEKINGGPFVMTGFDWDLGGAIIDAKDGKLVHQPGECLLGASFLPDDKTPEPVRSKVSGDGEFPSDSPDMKAVNPTVVQWSVFYPGEEMPEEAPPADDAAPADGTAPK
ncbi:hypothetical protein [Flaviflagellibacter deserti]|uniref:Uncharacterized protein n=1 Tax=Flaviflagellibacter deserti TaxID=2267266 RepID=A0ABV9YVB6_9HYPH